MGEKLRNYSYLLGGLIVQTGGIAQIIKMHCTKSVGDFAFFWLFTLLIGELLHLPRSLSSPYWVWKVICILGVVIILVLFVSYLIYR